MAKNTRKLILEEVAMEVGIHHKTYWSNYKDRNGENLKREIVKKKIFGRGKVEPKKMELNKFSIDIDKLDTIFSA